jgi:hypothetical protein
MTYQSEANTIRARLATWGGSATVVWDGFNSPLAEPPANASWIRPVILDAGAERIAFRGDGASRSRHQGLLKIQVFVPAGAGDDVGPALCDSLISHFDRWSSGGVIFRRRGEAERIGSDLGLRPFYQWAVTLPFHRDSWGSGLAGEIVDVAFPSKTVSQTAHGLAVGDWIGFNGSSWIEVAANGTHPRAAGVVVQVVSVDQFVVVLIGAASLPAHGYTLGPLWLSQGTAGAVGYSEPASGYVQRVGTAVDANTVLVESHPVVLK